MKTLIKRWTRIAFGEYQLYLIFSSPDVAKHLVKESPPIRGHIQLVDAETLEDSSDSIIREQASYAGADSHTYACFRENRIVGVCVFWFAERYRQRNFWPLRAGEAKLVQIVSIPEARGQGIAPDLLRAALKDMLERGFRKLYARIWHSNLPSIRAFQKAGWRRIALVIEINPLRRTRAFRLVFGRLFLEALDLVGLTRSSADTPESGLR